MNVVLIEPKVSHLVIRPMSSEDLGRLIELSPPDVKPTVQFFVYPTLIAWFHGVIVGYTQFTLTPDGILYSLAIRVDAAYKGQGIGQKLMETKAALATEAGAKMHFYALAHDGEEAIKRICLRLGMHLCQSEGNVDVYSMSLRPKGGG